MLLTPAFAFLAGLRACQNKIHYFLSLVMGTSTEEKGSSSDRRRDSTADSKAHKSKSHKHAKDRRDSHSKKKKDKKDKKDKKHSSDRKHSRHEKKKSHKRSRDDDSDSSSSSESDNSDDSVAKEPKKRAVALCSTISGTHKTNTLMACSRGTFIRIYFVQIRSQKKITSPRAKSFAFGCVSIITHRSKPSRRRRLTTFSSTCFSRHITRAACHPISIPVRENVAKINSLALFILHIHVSV